MAYELSGSDFSDFISPVPSPAAFINGHNSTQISLTGQKGAILYNEQALHSGLSIQEGNYSMNDDVRIVGRGEAALLEIQFNLSAAPIFYRDKHHVEHVTPARSGNIVFLAADENEASILFRKDTVYDTFDIHLPLTMFNRHAGSSRRLDKLLEQMTREVSDRLTPDAVTISPAIYLAIQEMKNCRYEGLTRAFFL
jgi:AraC family transcriptional regulator, transcriptional activator of the genes for pyochelin and ferripyochelin receptors